MYAGIEKSRIGCNLHGALQTVMGIAGVVPIVHSTPGCAIQQFYAAWAGGILSPYWSGFETPASNVYEKQIIFGGASRLREQMKNTVKVFHGDLYVVLSGCEAEMVGDDSSSMTAELAEQGVSVICYESAGFKGDVYRGYAGVVDAIFSQLPAVSSLSGKTEKNLVNILGLIPGQDLCWQGNLQEIQRILGSLGVQVNTLFGYGQTIADWKRAYQAELTIVLSQWGLKAAETLRSTYGIPYVEAYGAFLGEEETALFVHKIAALLSLDTEKIKPYLRGEKERFIHALRQLTEYYVTYPYQKEWVMVGDAGTIRRYGTFLNRVLGFSLKRAIVTDAPAGEETPEPSEDLAALAEHISFSKDSGEIAALIADSKAGLVLGSGLEQDVARRLGIPHLIVSYPSEAAVILNRCDVGYTGALTVLEQVSNLIIAHERCTAR
ncbi:MAG: hydrogenase [Treponema sp.]|jgi:nitrogenase molybdenum-iron protein beta chain|nr:hydrogenase [Treponema sp.]